MAMLKIDDETRNKLRRYKAQDGLTYTEAIERLLNETGWNND
jgi:antitoxin component of RelBE/YafQ-DinJ toxin-antitoxin module